MDVWTYEISWQSTVVGPTDIALSRPLPLAELKIAKWIGGLISFYLSKDVICYVVQCVVTARASCSLRSSTLGEQQWIEQQLCLLEIFRNVYIFMHPKHLWMLADWKLLEHNKGIATQLEVIIYQKQNKQIHIYALMFYLKWLYLNKFNVILIVRFGWGTVFTARWERVTRFLNNVLVVAVSQDGHQETSIPVVCHTATIVALPGQVSYGLEGHLIIFIYK